MERFLQYQRNMLILIVALSAGVFAALMAFHDDPTAAWGWGVGAIAGAVIFHLRAAHIVSLQNLPQASWVKEGIKANFKSLAIMLAAFAAGIYFKELNPWGVIAGLLLERIVLRGDGWLRPNALMDTEEQGVGGASGEAADSAEEADSDTEEADSGSEGEPAEAKQPE